MSYLETLGGGSRIVSLQDMGLKLLLGDLYFQLRSLDQAERYSPAVIKAMADDILGTLERLEGPCKDFDLTQSLKAIARVRPRFKALEQAAMASEVRHIRELVESETGDRYVYSITKENGDLLDSTYERWGALNTRFPAIAPESDGAIICFAVDEYTACTFHLMRIAEIGLRALAHELAVVLPKDKPLEWGLWGEIIRDTRKRADAILAGKPPGPGKDEAMAFYSRAVGHIEAFKYIYRDQTMHVRARFDRHQAASAMGHVREFMEGLATKITEANPGPIAWVF